MDFIERTPFFWSTGGFVALSIIAIVAFVYVAACVETSRRSDPFSFVHPGTVVGGGVAMVALVFAAPYIVNLKHTSDHLERVAEAFDERYGLGWAPENFSESQLRYPRTPSSDGLYGQMSYSVYDAASENIKSISVALVQKDGKFILIDTNKGGELPLKGAPQKEGK